MSYQIQYPVTVQLEKKYRLKSKSPGKSVVVFMCVILLIISVYIVGAEKIVHYMIPGNKEVTITAFSQMQSSLENGMAVKDAIAAFCAEIIEAARIQ